MENDKQFVYRGQEEGGAVIRAAAGDEDFDTGGTNMSRYFLVILMFASVAFGISGCGGGDAGYAPANVTPVANAGGMQAVYPDSVVTLDGSRSYDADGNALAYFWVLESKPAGSKATLANPSAANPTFTADIAGTYVIKLVVTDGKATSTPSTVIVNVAPVVNVIDESHSGVHQWDTIDLDLGTAHLVDVTRVKSNNPIFTYTEGVDYTVEIALGRIAIVRGGRIDRNGVGADLLISYRFSL